MSLNFEKLMQDGVADTQDAIEHYSDLCDQMAAELLKEMQDHNITPSDRFIVLSRMIYMSARIIDCPALKRAIEVSIISWAAHINRDHDLEDLPIKLEFKEKG